MSTGVAAERRLLAEDEYEPVARSHYPALRSLAREDLTQLARWLRSRRNRACDIIRERRRSYQGRVPPPGGAPEVPSEQRGMSAKKQVFARALRRVNAQIGRLLAAEAREQNLGRLRAALERRRAAPVHHRASDRTARQGMRPHENLTDMVQVEPGQIGPVSQAGRDAQARRDDARARGST
jgi:hypothetical protein